MQFRNRLPSAAVGIDYRMLFRHMPSEMASNFSNVRAKLALVTTFITIHVTTYVSFKLFRSSSLVRAMRAHKISRNDSAASTRMTHQTPLIMVVFPTSFTGKTPDSWINETLSLGQNQSDTKVQTMENRRYWSAPLYSAFKISFSSVNRQVTTNDWHSKFDWRLLIDANVSRSKFIFSFRRAAFDMTSKARFVIGKIKTRSAFMHDSSLRMAT